MASNEGALETGLLHNLYTEGRQVLEKDIQGLDTTTLDWRGLDPNGAVTIGSQLVHIAGFDNLVRSALLGENLSDMAERPEWRECYGPGFPRELNTTPPTGRSLEYYIDILKAETTKTSEVIKCLGDFAIDLNDTTIFYEDGKEFTEAGLRPHSNRELLFYIPMHDRYHRGQITQQKYNFGVVKRLLAPGENQD